MTLVTLKADHQKFLCAEEGGGPQGQTIPVEQAGVIHHRPKGLLTATRATASAWEHFDIVESDEKEYYGLISSDGWVACCENAEEDAAKGRNGVIIFNRESIGPWEKFRLIASTDGTRVSFESKVRPGYFIKAHPTGDVTLEQSFVNGEPTGEPGGYETFIVDPPFRSLTKPSNPITGQLRVTDHGYEDDNGAYLPIGIHMGDLFSCYCHGRIADVEDALTKISGAGYGLVQFWLNLGSLGGDYWAGREIGPEITPEYWNKLRTFSDMLDSYGLKGIYCGGDYALRGMSWKDFGKQLGETLIGRNTGALVIAGNEAWQTGANSVDDLMQFVDGFESTGCHTPITTTCPPSESKEDIDKWCRGDFYCIHGWRDGEDHDRIRHIFSVPWEGEPPEYCGYQDEPTGPGDKVSVKANHCYHGRDVDASHLVALAAQSLMTNQGFNYFCNNGIKLESGASLEATPGFNEVANVVNLVPRDIMNWGDFFHFGDSQSDRRIFSPSSGNQVRFDQRVNGNKFFGMLYGDEGSFSVRCEKRCHIILKNYKGEIVQERNLNPGEQLTGNFTRSQSGQPGSTSYLVNGELI